MEGKMNLGLYESMQDWLDDCKIHMKVFRMWERSNLDVPCTKIRIAQLVLIPGDILMGVDFVDGGWDSDNSYLDYYRWSDVKLAYLESDNTEQEIRN